MPRHACRVGVGGDRPTRRRRRGPRRRVVAELANAPGTLGSSERRRRPCDRRDALPPTFAAEPSPPSAASGRTLPLANVALDRGSDSVGVTDSSPVAAPAATDESRQRPRAPRAASWNPRRAQPTLPSAAALAAEGVALPELRLELHVYRAQPRDRFLIINGSRYREGETLAEGPRVVAIDPTGAVLSTRAASFCSRPSSSRSAQPAPRCRLDRAQDRRAADRSRRSQRARTRTRRRRARGSSNFRSAWRVRASELDPRARARPASGRESARAPNWPPS